MSIVRALLTSMRPRQWTKNIIVVAPLLFAAKFTEPPVILLSLAAFGIFCIISGAVYLVNDVRDIESDRLNERKRTRPIAAGTLKPGVAIGAAVALAGLSLALSFALSLKFGVIAAAYLLLQTAYTFFLKDQVILDVMSISAGFVLRAAAGAVAISVAFSPWLLSCAALLALFLALGKRRHELLLLESGAIGHRKSLGDYSAQFIDQMVSAITAANIVTYALYTSFSPTAQTHHYLMLTVPFVVYGLFRYLYLVHQKHLGDNPEEILLTDVPLIIDIVLYLAVSVAAITMK